VTHRLDPLPERRLPGGLRLAVARSRRARLCGLAFLGELPADRALLLERCRSVHTFGMRFAVDLVWLDAGRRVVRVDDRVPPRRVRSCRAARHVVEVTSGAGPAWAAVAQALGDACRLA
jgi:uncharacterized membrane protein (UPF0127 family)